MKKIIISLCIVILALSISSAVMLSKIKTLELKISESTSSAVPQAHENIPDKKTEDVQDEPISETIRTEYIIITEVEAFDGAMSENGVAYQFPSKQAKEISQIKKGTGITVTGISMPFYRINTNDGLVTDAYIYANLFKSS